MRILPKTHATNSKRGTAKYIVCKKAAGKGENRIGKSVPYEATHIV